MIRKIARLVIPIMAMITTLAVAAPAQAAPEGKRDLRAAFQNAASQDGLVAAAQPVAVADDCATAYVAYRVHIRDVGWQEIKCDGIGAGTVGENRPIEAIQIVGLGNVCYRVHVQNLGWLGKVCDGSIAGTVGEARQMEAIAITDNVYQICYVAHVQNLGWQPEVCNGVIAGTVGQNLALEAIRIYYKW